MGLKIVKNNIKIEYAKTTNDMIDNSEVYNDFINNLVNISTKIF